jgi:hypothetical protein
MRKFTMSFEPMTIEHLGLRLYSTMPPVISELVSNAYDAESSKVEVIIPPEMSPDAEVIVRDWGHGMTEDEVQDEFLPIGRNRRGADSKLIMSKHGKVRVTGRKGLGKLSGLGVAREIEVRSVCKGEAVCIRMNYDDMLAWARKNKTDYEPVVVKERCGPTKDTDGVEVVLRKLRRQRAISVQQIRDGLVIRLSFIGKTMEVLVNGEKLKPRDRREECEKAWNITAIPPRMGTIDADHKVDGWIGFVEDSSHAGRGVDIYASGKAVEIGSFFNYPSTHAQFARAHLVGEVQAQFLDDEEDLAATARNSVVWESEAGLALQAWGQEALKWAFDQWLESRTQRKAGEILKLAGFDKWLDTRTATEQKVAKRMIGLLANDERIDPESAGGLLDIVKASVETVAFHDLVDTIETDGGDPAQLLRLFQEWRIIEAREHLKLADGRVEAISKLQEFIEEGALEVQQLQPLFEKNLWLIDPTWTEAASQPTYSKLLKQQFPEPKKTADKDRRLDLLGIRAGGALTIVELKRPEKVLSRKDLDQIESYVDWARGMWGGGSGPDSPKYVNGMLLVGKLSNKADVLQKLERLQGDDIRVETFLDLHHRSREYYRHVEKRLQGLAPEYASKARKKAKAKKTEKPKGKAKPKKKKGK